MIIKAEPDRQKANSLVEMAKITLERLKETDKEKYPSNTLTDYYDIIRKLMEALNSLEGIKIKGESAHYEIVDYICSKYNLGEQNRAFIQEMRDFRNRISYEGFIIKANYINPNSKKIEKIIKKLFSLIEDEQKMEIKQLKEISKKYADSQGFKLQKDDEIRKMILWGLLKNEQKYGSRYCPCRARTGDKSKDAKIICPCAFHKDEIKKDGYCRCRLFLRK